MRFYLHQLKRLFLSPPFLYWSQVLLLIVIWLGLAIQLRIPAYLAGERAMFDFDAYYGNIVSIVRDGEHPFAFQGMQTLGPPSVFIPFLPFAFVSQEMARGAITLVNLICLWATSWLLARHLFKRAVALATAFLALIFLLAFPTRFTIDMGQTNLISMLLITLILTTKNRASGALSGLLVILKTNYILVLASLIKKKRP
jgi:hypothetical protein